MFHVAVAGDKVSSLPFDRCFNYGIIVDIAADDDITRKQGMFGAFFNEDEEFLYIAFGDAVFILD